MRRLQLVLVVMIALAAWLAFARVDHAQQRIVSGGYPRVPAVIYQSPATNAASTPVVVPAVVDSSFTSGSRVYPASAISPGMISLSASNLSPSSLGSLLQSAKQQLSVQQLPSMDTARGKVDSALRELESFIGLGTTNGHRWSRFLKLDVLREELQKERPSVAVLTEWEMNMRQNYLGLEYPQFTRLRDGLAEYVRALRYSTAPELTLQFLEREIDRISKELEKPTDENFDVDGAVATLVNLLAGAEQAPQLVSQLRSRYSHPNLQFTVQESFVNRLISRTVAEPSPVRENILGTDIYGNACLTGQVSADLKPLNNGILLSLNLTGQLTSQNRGYNRGVVLNTSGNSPVFASKQIYVTPAGISSGSVSTATDLSTQIHSIQHKSRIVRRIASKRAAKQKPQADAIAEGRLQKRLASQYDFQVNQQLAEATPQYNRLMTYSPPELGRVGLQRPRLDFNSTDNSVMGSVLQASNSQLAASGPSGLPRSTTSQVLVEAHQSALTNALEILLGGRRIRSENLDEYAQQILGRVPEQTMQEAAGEAWSISLASSRPVEIQFDDRQIKISIRVTELTRDDQVLRELFVISATYVPDFRNGVLTLTREGPVDFRFGDARGFRILTLRTFVRDKFEQAFKEQVVLDRLELGNRFPKLGAIDVDSWQLDQGWLQIGLH